MAEPGTDIDRTGLAVRELSTLFGSHVVVLTAENQLAHLATLSEREAELVAGAVDKRKREFATGRFLARRALARFGRPNAEILRGPQYEPLWPAGMCGSISHCDTRAVVAVAERDRTGSVGIDIEHRTELARKLWERILLPQELAELERDFAAPERGRRALLLFSAKEAFYKAQYPWSTQLLDFHAVHVQLDRASYSHAQGGLLCVLQIPVASWSAGSSFRGRYALDSFPAGELVSAVSIEPPAHDGT